MRRPGIPVVAGLTVTAVVAAALGTFALTQGGTADDGAQDPQPSTATAQQRTLQVVDEVTGQLGHGAAEPVHGRLSGTLTAAASAGDTVQRGEQLFAVDDRPVTLLYGELPAWRTLAEGTEGRDVAQLEENLVVLGHGDGLTPDETFDADTTAAVERWQEATGATVDGVVDLGEVVFHPGAVWVAERQLAPGAQVTPGAPVLAVAGTDRLVTVALSPGQLDGIAEGGVLDLELPDGSAATGTVEEIAASPTADPQTGARATEVTILLADGAVDGVSDGSVTVRVIRQERVDVLAVPVTALLALLEGGYAVEVVADDGSVSLAGVRVGIFADGWVEVTEVTAGELVPGDEVVVP